MSTLQERLQALAPNIEKILMISSTAGASVGVLHRGEVVFRGNYGFRDHALSTAPDSDTLYNVGSLTKSMIAATAAIQVSKGKLRWNTRVSDVVPEFRTSDRTISDNCNIIDLLAHRTGLPSANVLWYQGGSKPLVQKNDLLQMINAMPPMAPFRSTWGYSNWPYCLAGEVIERVSGQPWHETLRQSLWEPLGMRRTTTSAHWRQQDNVAEGFSGLESGKPHPITSQVADDSSIMGPAGGVCTSINELLVYYTALMKASHQPEFDNKSNVASNPFGDVQTILSPHAVLTPPPFGLFTETTYALGLARGQLPGKVEVISDNTALVKEMPLIGKGTAPQLVLYHSGTLSGFYSSVYLLPETQSCVVSLTNTKPICDSADWIAQHLLDTMLGAEESPDFVALTTESVEAQSQRYDNASNALESERVPGTKPKPAEQYLGRYYWTCPRYYIDIEPDGEGLRLVIMGREDQRYHLQHYHYDSFTWFMGDDEEMKRGRFIQSTYTYKISFNCNERDEVETFTWPEMGGMTGTFSKSNGQLSPVRKL
ncbi:MAG: hypothetical protein Q9186_007182 [Xanthomendoza sp. 1 TL-2023]